jgi:hypothetical protein
VPDTRKRRVGPAQTPEDEPPALPDRPRPASNYERFNSERFLIVPCLRVPHSHFDSARTPPEELVNPASAPQTLRSALRGAEPNQPGSTFPQSPGIILETSCNFLSSIPRPDGHPTWFIDASAAGRIGSRTDLPHCAPMRRLGADGARDWLHQSDQSDHRDLRASEPLVASTLSPDIPAEPLADPPLRPKVSVACSLPRPIGSSTGLHSPSGLLHPSGSKCSAGFAPISPPSGSARFPLAPRFQFYF